ncbi:flagellar motor switch protein FliN/FliY [Rhizobium sp. RU35A]|uniref:flagellar motor switch protein FliN n=1 Tax=Rhizobium sp. RU35A TaxID=1907414 RepID=UPI000956845E|nr:flagellar motor switch protein FliN [Rhizobium sp. RU35A]SIQ02836.1 flagellar motor switch protein FliN/FliY [Rhizobium sp. RU35A]
MATKKTPATDEDAFPPLGNESELDQAIDDLRGVLKADSDGAPGDFGAEFGSEFGSTDTAMPTSDFGGGLDMGAGMGSSLDSDFGGPDLGGTAFGGGDIGGDFGGGGFGGAGFGGDTGAASMQEPGSALTANLDLIMDIPITVEIVLGTSRMQVSGLMGLEEGAIIALDKKIGEPVEITVNGRRIARGEITVLENDDTRFGVKLTEVLSTKKV